MGPSPPPSDRLSPPPPDHFAQGPAQPATSPYPLDLGRVAALSRSLFRHAWVTLVAISALCVAPAYVVAAIAAALFGPTFDRWYSELQAAATAGLPPPPTPPDFGLAMTVLIAAGLVVLLASAVAGAALIRAIDVTYRGGRAGARESALDGLRRAGSLLAGQIVFLLILALIVITGLSMAAPLLIGGGLATFMGLVVAVATVAAVLFVAVRMSLFVPALVIEPTGGVEALARSWRLTAGSGWRVFGYICLIGLLLGLFSLVMVELPALMLRLSGTVPVHQVAGTALDGIAAVIAAPVAQIALTLLYYDLRWRRGEPTPIPGTRDQAAPPAPLRTGL
jgi:hypothetical protein